MSSTNRKEATTRTPTTIYATGFTDEQEVWAAVEELRPHGLAPAVEVPESRPDRFSLIIPAVELPLKELGETFKLIKDVAEAHGGTYDGHMVVNGSDDERDAIAKLEAKVLRGSK